MADVTKIEWCDSTFNPWIGCTAVSPACDDCYAARSTPARAMGISWGPGQQRHRTSAHAWREPLRWEKYHHTFEAAHGRRRRVFCASLADVFDNEVPPIWRAELFDVIKATPHLDWLLLTKRIGNAQRMIEQALIAQGDGATDAMGSWPWANVWLGATIVNQTEADRDIPKLLAVPAAVRFLSIEPMLGSVDVCKYLIGHECAGTPLGGGARTVGGCSTWTPPVDWVIAGGESGRGARPMHPDWVRSLRDQCAAAGVPFLFKQWGEWTEHDAGRPTRTFSMDSDIGETLASRCDGFISKSGEFVNSMDAATTDDPYRGMQRVGKKAAGRVLDGVEHNGFPEVSW